jgi:hypothetical protein
MLPNVDLSWMRADVANTLPDTCILLMRTTGSSASGGATATYTPVGTVACRFDPLSERSRIMIQANSPLINAEGILTLPYGTGLVAHSHVSLNGHTYEELDVALDRSWSVCERSLIAKAE